MTNTKHLVSKIDFFSQQDKSGSGEKAAGLINLGSVPDWIPNFFVLKSSIYEHVTGHDCAEIYEYILLEIYNALTTCVDFKEFISATRKLIIRSSADNETLNERGQYKSISSESDVGIISQTCAYIIFDLFNKSHPNKISLIIQYEVENISSGHLSNERRVSERSRDWLVDYENVIGGVKKENERFKIFKNRYDSDRVEVPTELKANSLKQVNEVLHFPAILATIHFKGIRIHYEWVWDGSRVWIVQADKDLASEGINPHDFISIQANSHAASTLVETQKLTNVRDVKSRNFKKIEHQIIFHEAGLATTNLWVVTGNIAFKKNKQDRNILYREIELLIKNGPIVIRSDLDSSVNEQASRQNLPRSESISNADDAINFINSCEHVLTKIDPITEHHCFIIHNYIPSLSSAFVYATPNNPRVRVDSIWGLPDGLQYYAHDSFELDSKKNEIVREKKRYKGFMLGASFEGNWSPAKVAEPYDWRSSISPSNCKEIASHTLKLSKYLKKSIQVMWFVQTSEYSPHPVNIPWYFEERVIDSFDTENYDSVYSRKLVVIKEMEDIANARQIFISKPWHTAILLNPHESNIRCNKFLDEVSKLSIELNKAILFHGSILQHAFYQLRKSGAKVSCMEPFSPTVSKFEYKKLVRDKIPSIIENDGEIVEFERVTGERLIELLEEKILEESQEIAGASNRQERINEIADLFEVISSLCRLEDIKFGEIKSAQKIKRNKIGGFNEGIYLLKSITMPTISVEQQSSKPVVRKKRGYHIKNRISKDETQEISLREQLELLLNIM